MSAWDLRLALSLLTLLAWSGCARQGVSPVRMAIGDPLDLIDDVEGPLRLLVLEAESFACDPETGSVTPEVPDANEGVFEAAIAELSLDVRDSQAQTEVTVPTGEYVVLVRGRGTDPVSGRPDVIIASACAQQRIDAGETVELRLTLIEVFGEGVCGDGVLSPDEQCEDNNTEDDDGCSSTCRSERQTVNTSNGMLERPSVAGARARRWVIAFDLDQTETYVRMLEPDGSTVESPSLLATDGQLPMQLGQQLGSAVAVARTGRFALAYTDFSGGANVQIEFFNENRTSEGAGTRVFSRSDGDFQPSVAFASDGTMIIGAVDLDASSQRSVQLFEPNQRTPRTATPTTIGFDGSEGSIAVAGYDAGFAVAFDAEGDVYVQRGNLDGTLEGPAIPVLTDDDGTQDQPALAALADGRTLVAFRTDAVTADGDGTAIVARLLASDGTWSGPPFVVNTQLDGDQANPDVAAGEDAFLVTFRSVGAIRARVIGSDGDPGLNRDRPPSRADFHCADEGSDPRAAAGGPAERPSWLVTWSEGRSIGARLVPQP